MIGEPDEPRALRTAGIISEQLQQHNGGLLEDVTSAQPSTGEPEPVWAQFFVTDNDGIRYIVYVTAAPPELV